MTQIGYKSINYHKTKVLFFGIIAVLLRIIFSCSRDELTEQHPTPEKTTVLPKGELITLKSGAQVIKEGIAIMNAKIGSVNRISRKIILKKHNEQIKSLSK